LFKKKFRILVCPLDWGIGHATRCVPVIRHLLEIGQEVVLAADGRSFDFLSSHFPALEIIRFPGIKISYPKGNRMALKMMAQFPGILVQVIKEHRRLKKVVKEHKIDIVISDNRFGLFTHSARTVYITHQVMIKAPKYLNWVEPLLHRAHRWIIEKYDHCWVPDLPGESNLSGDLGHKYPLPGNAKFAGLLSRFTDHRPPTADRRPPTEDRRPPTAPYLLALLSGPEPQRNLLEAEIIRQAGVYSISNLVILQGLPGEIKDETLDNGVRLISHLPDDELKEFMLKSDVIICRSGYSTLMDLAALGKTAVLVPTPGQTEQEYLADYLSGKGLFDCMRQDALDLRIIMDRKQQGTFSSFPLPENKYLEERISELLSNAGNE